jgi:hypothetical protein
MRPRDIRAAIVIVAVAALLGAAASTAGGVANAAGASVRPPNINNCRKAKPSCVPRAPGVRRLRVATVKPHRSGKFKHFNSRGGEEGANEDFPWKVLGKLPRGKLAPTNGLSSIGGQPGSPVGGKLGVHPSSVTFSVNTSLQNTVDFCRNNSCSLPPDPSGADSGRIVLETGNWKSYGAVSRDGGASFSLLDPTTIFPSGPAFTTIHGRRVRLDGGMCCDQVVQYVPQINRFIWLMQFSGTGGGTTGTNKLRIAAATPAVVAGGGSWTYWDLTSATFGLPGSNPNMDYPDLAVGTNSLFVSVDNVGAGLLVMRIPLSQIAASSAINIGYTTPSDSGTAYGGHLTQNVGDTAYWAGHVDNRTMRIFSMKDSEGVYRWRDVGINSWCNGNNSSSVPGGTNWLGGSGGFPGNSVLGSTLRSSNQSGNELWFAWGAGHAMASGTPGRCGFPQSHIQIVVLNASNYHFLAQMQVWNPSIAFGYPSLASDPNGDIAMSLGYGGGGNHAAHAVGFWGDFLVYTTTAGDTSLTRFGDYVTVRRSWPNTNQFSAAGYSTKIANQTNNCPANGTLAAGFGSSQNFCFDPHYINFGR